MGFKMMWEVPMRSMEYKMKSLRRPLGGQTATFVHEFIRLDE